MSFLEEALKYAEMGWTVLPLTPGLKRPMVDWVEWQDKTPSEKQIREWWGRTPNANIGAITGKQWVVVDVDTYKTGADPKAIFDSAPTDMIVRSARGGWHLYYDAGGKDLGNRANVDLKGIDIRGDKGVIVLPPSVFEGQEYRWVRRGKIGAFPWSLLETPKAVTQTDRPQWVTDYWGGINDGNRNQGCAELAGYFESKGLPEDIVLTMLLDWDKKNTPPMGPDIVETTVHSVYKTAARNSSRDRKKVVAAGTRVSRSSRPFSVTPFVSFMTKYADKAQTWIVDDWLMDESVLMVVASPGSYKSWLTYDLAISVATGSPLFGKYPIIKKGPVIVVQQEDSLSGTAGRFAEIAVSKAGPQPQDDPDNEDEFDVTVPPPIPVFFHEDRMLKFEDAVVMADFEAAIEAIRPVLIVLDPLYSLLDTDEYMARIGEHMLKLKTLRDKYGCTFVLVHHAKKNGDGGREDAWGSTFVNAAREGGWSISKPDAMEEAEHIQIRRFFKDGGEFKPIDMTVHIDTKSKEHVFQISIDESGDNAGSSTVGIMDTVLEAVTEKQRTPAELATLTGKTLDSINKVLKVLQEDGLVTKYGRKWGPPLKITTDF